MKDPRFHAIVRAFTDGTVTRRTLGQGLAGSAIAAGLAQLGLDSADAKRRGKKRKTKKRKKRRGGSGRQKCTSPGSITTPRASARSARRPASSCGGPSTQ